MNEEINHFILNLMVSRGQVTYPTLLYQSMLGLGIEPRSSSLKSNIPTSIESRVDMHLLDDINEVCVYIHIR